jgi:SAM-dependent methyltransferase
MTRPAKGYDGEAGRRLAALYEAVEASDVHAALTRHLPPPPASLLDVGAGSGRDAAWFAGEGYNVLAVEPSATMRAEAQRRHTLASIVWLDDCLPGLDAVLRLGAAFDVILVSAVWMHVQPTDRSRAFRKLVTLLKPGGLLALSLRLGPPDPDRDMHPVDVTEIETLARNHGVAVVDVVHSPDRLGRADISWVQMVLRLPDDGTGALPLLRHVILNDAKSATYKLGLLRALARTADGSQGVARMHDDSTVAVPLGLIALNWLRLYKPLITANLPQMPRNHGELGLGFIKDGWHGISDLSAMDLRVGAQFRGARGAALHSAMRDAAATIARMPATFMTYPGTQTPVLPAHLGRPGRAPGRIMVDAEYLRRFGEILVPQHLWRALVRHDSWIEPALVTEWVRLMEGYARGQGRDLDPGVVARAMRWHDPSRDVAFARKTAFALMERGPVFCVWTGQRLTESRLDIDHCLPWAAWPCEDLWNLMPAHPVVNRHGKRDRIPAAEALDQSMDRIIDWWERAWLRQPGVAERFQVEARASLPLVHDVDGNAAQVFAGLQARRFALRADQQVPEWQFS